METLKNGNFKLILGENYHIYNAFISSDQPWMCDSTLISKDTDENGIQLLNFELNDGEKITIDQETLYIYNPKNSRKCFMFIGEFQEIN